MLYQPKITLKLNWIGARLAIHLGMLWRGSKYAKFGHFQEIDNDWLLARETLSMVNICHLDHSFEQISIFLFSIGIFLAICENSLFMKVRNGYWKPFSFLAHFASEVTKWSDLKSFGMEPFSFLICEPDLPWPILILAIWRIFCKICLSIELL